MQKEALGMILLLIIYLLFQIGYDQWSQPGVVWDVVYFTFQWLWIAGVALVNIPGAKFRLAFLLIAVIFVGLAVNELLCLNLTGEQYSQVVNDNTPAFTLTGITVLLFITHEIIRWKKRLN